MCDLDHLSLLMTPLQSVRSPTVREGTLSATFALPDGRASDRKKSRRDLMTGPRRESWHLVLDYCANRCRYLIEVMSALIISTSM